MGGRKFTPGAVANVKHFNLASLLQNAIDHTIDVGLAAVKQMPELALFGRQRAAVRQIFKAGTIVVFRSNPAKKPRARA
jgi:hypothetical protein